MPAPPSRSRLAALLLSGTGAALATAHVRTAPGAAPRDLAIGVAPFLLMSLAIAGAGLWLASDRRYGDDLGRVLGWTLGGGTAFASVAVLSAVHRSSPAPLLSLLDLFTAGALSGLLVGAYDARSRDRLREIQRQRDRVRSFAEKSADVNNYGRLLNQATDVDEIAALALEGAGLLVGHTDAAFLTTTPELRVVDATIPDDELDEMRAIAEIALDSDGATVVDDIDHGDFRPWIAVPARLGDDAVAVLLCAVSGPAHLEDEDLRLLDILASHAATALDPIT